MNDKEPVVQHNNDRYVAIELAGVMREYLDMPCKSLEDRMRKTLERYKPRIDAMIKAHQGVLESDQLRQSEPVALPARKAITAHGLTALDGEAEGWNAYHDEIAKLGPLYTRADPGEVEQHVRRRMEMAEQKAELYRQISDLRSELGAEIAKRNSAESMWHQHRADAERYRQLRKVGGMTWSCNQSSLRMKDDDYDSCVDEFFDLSACVPSGGTFKISKAINLNSSTTPDTEDRVKQVLREVRPFFADGNRDATSYLQLCADLGLGLL